LDHIIEAGECIYDISQKYSVTMAQIFCFNSHLFCEPMADKYFRIPDKNLPFQRVRILSDEY
jgi:hypothetical protein